MHVPSFFAAYCDATHVICVSATRMNDVPAGYTTTVYEPQYVLSEDKKTYISVTGEVESKLPNPMPISLMVWAGPGSDATVIKVSSAYEAASKHRVPPPAFGPVTTSARRLSSAFGLPKRRLAPPARMAPSGAGEEAMGPS